MKMLTLIIIVSCWVATLQNPLISRCFHGGQLIAEKKSLTSISEFCIKDDVSMLKSEVIYQKNDTGIYGHSKVFRHWTIADWKYCNPVPTAGGSINVIELDKNLNLIAKNYVCTRDCTITVDKENAQIVFQTDKLNHFEVTGTTISTGWFKTKASVALDRTCEHIKVSCGKKTLQFHACFKQHMSCVRFLHRSMLPGSMANSICQNIELIIIITLTLVIFILMLIATRFYICYLLIPVFMPIAYAYGWAYNRSCKKCSCCGLAYHPFTNCGSYCVCGARFETSDRMRLHRESGLCQGFKSLRMARRLCKSKGSSLVISILLATLILSFVTPIEGTMTNYPTNEKYSLDEIADVLKWKEQESEYKYYAILYASIIGACFTVLFAGTALALNIVLELLTKINVIYCEECSMYHSKSNIKYIGDFTNKCGFCTCGLLEDPDGVVVHKVKRSCTYQYKLTWVKTIMIVLSILFLLQNIIVIVAADSDCWTNEELKPECVGPLIAPADCTEKDKKTYLTEAAALVKTKKISQVDADNVEILGKTIESAIKAIEKQKTYHRMHLLEAVFLNKHCDYYKLFEHNSGYSQVKWRMLAKTQHFDICAFAKESKFCKCMAGGACAEDSWDFDTTMNSTYTSKGDNFKHDMSLFLKIFEAAFPGTSYVYMLNKIKEKKPYQSVTMIDKIKTKYPNNKMLVAYLEFGKCLMGVGHASTFELQQSQLERLYQPAELSRSVGQLTSLSNAQVGTITKECSKYKDISCLSPRFGIPMENMVACGDSPNYKIYKKPIKVYKAHDRVETWCIKDQHCLVDYTPAEADVVKKLKTMKCWLNDPGTETDAYTTAIKSCRIMDKGVCTVNGQKWSIIKCDSDLLYYTDHIEGEDTGNDIGHYCISVGCKTDRYPINPDIVTDCTWEFKSRKSSYIGKISMQSLEDYKKALTDKLTHTLETYSFAPTADLPHIKPIYKYITAQGVENSDGIEGAYITATIPALGGTSIGYSVQSKDGFPLLDLIIYIKAAVIRSTYIHLYDTGPTISINTKHDEKCTGQCPAEIEHEANWLTFSQERTSRWGCEEFGCLAINTGCVFGSCQDVIRPETKVYRKSVEEEVVLTVCINYPGNTFCTEINAIEPKITEEVELQFKTVDTKTLPTLLAVTNHKLFSGQINDLGTFGQMCGNVQKTNSSILGSGTPKFDYTCHGASRKDIIVRKCYNNNYDSCKLLKEEKQLVFNDDHETITVVNNRHLVGELAIKLILGDIQYKLFTEKLDLQIDAKCVGCPDCFESYACNFQIVSNIDTVCAINGPCDIFHNRISIRSTQQNYGVKMSCKRTPDQNEKFVICGREYSVFFHTVQKNDKIEINTGDQTSYIKEMDTRCKTWLCRVRDEGLSVIFEPIKAFFGSYFSIAFYIVLFIIIAFLVIYIFMPMFMKLRDILKQNEKLYLQEIKQK
ncbi:glycoprotein precursor [Batai virus]|uniref:Envelopment polyprotein n=1 Tax=Batai virus TaxID=80942 RepID=K9R5H8_9VIRU|nr:glycoprotein precursor [Batai virus]AFY52604.1 glycoprotein precursor [Batai virus]